MHIAHLLRKYDPSEWGGTESVMLRLTEGLRRQRIRSTVFCPAIAKDDAPDPLAQSGCAIRRFKAVLPVWGISAERRRQMIAVGGNLLSFDLPRLLWEDRSISVIHTHTLGRIGGIGLTLAKRRKIPFVLTVHGGVYDLPEALRRSFNEPVAGGWEWGKPFGMLFRARRVLDEADAVLTCNPREAELIRERHPDRLVMVQPHGVPAALYAVEHRESALQAFPGIRERSALLSLGRIDPVKNQGWLIEQLPEILRRHPDVMLVLAGACTDEAYERALEKRIDELGLRDHVLITGKLPPGDPRLIGLLQVARVTLLPSVSETFGLVILEAWAAGTPVVSSRTSGASALIDDGGSGWLFDLGDPRAFHAGVDQALTNEEARRRVVAAGSRRAASEFDTGVLAGRVGELYGRLVEEKNALRYTP